MNVNQCMLTVSRTLKRLEEVERNVCEAQNIFLTLQHVMQPIDFIRYVIFTEGQRISKEHPYAEENPCQKSSRD